MNYLFMYDTMTFFQNLVIFMITQVCHNIMINVIYVILLAIWLVGVVE